MEKQESKGVNLIGEKIYSIKITGYQISSLSHLLRICENRIFVAEIADSLEKQLVEMPEDDSPTLIE